MTLAFASLAFILLYGISYGVILFTISVGLVLTLGLMRVINLAHGAFAAIGGYFAVEMMNAAGIPFAAAIVIAVAATALLAIAVERLFYVHLYSASDLDQVLMTVGLMFLATATLNLFFGPDIIPGKLPPLLAENVDLGFRTFQTYRIFVVILGAALIIALWFLFDRTEFGARLRAAVDNRGMAEAMGIDVTRLFTTAFVLGCALAALGGAVGYPVFPLEPLYPFKYLTLVLIVVSLADFGNIKASAGAAIIVGVIDTAGRYLFPVSGSFLVYILFIFVMMRRSGILTFGRAA